MGYLDKRKSENRKQLGLWVATIVIFIISLANFLFKEINIIDSILSYRWQIFHISCLLFIISIIFLNFKTTLLTLIAIVINFGQIAAKTDLFSHVPNPKEIWAEPIVRKITTINIKGDESSYVKMYDYISKENPDFIVLYNAVDVDFLSKISLSYPFSKMNNHIAFFSKEDFVGSEFAVSDKVLWARFISGNNKRFALIAANLEKTRTFKKYKEYLANIKSITEISNRFDEPVVLIGGFNAPPWENKLDKLGNASFKTNIFYGNYPNFLPQLLRRPFDYVYTHSGIDIVKYEVGKDNGSKYLPITTTISVRPI